MNDLSDDFSKEKKEERNGTQPPKRSRAQRIAALICVILLAGLYLLTLIMALFDKSATKQWFMLSLIGTLVVPLLCWIYIWMYGVMTKKHTMASFDLGKTGLNRDHDEENGSVDAMASTDPSSDRTPQ